MADKSTALSIVIRTVDRATAGIQAINARLAVLTKPMKEFGKATSDLRDHLGLLGLDAVKDGFSGVGSAVTNVLGKVAMVGGVVGVAVAGLLSLVDHFDQLGDTAERLGTSADFLAAFRYAAERAGAPLEGVDQALQTLVTNMGAAKAGTGKMLKFLNEISPALARQVTAAHSLEEALGLLADAEAKLPDEARRSKLAAATLGDPALAPLLARGAKGVQELLTEYHAFAGSQGEAAEAAGKTDDALKKLHASTDGVKAALVTGLSPALTEIIGKMTTWLVDHRADVAKWAEDIGKKLPAAVDKVVEAVQKALGWVSEFIDDIGGWKVALAAVAAVMVGPLLSAITTLSIALLTTPFGWFLTGIAAVALAIVEVIKHWGDLTRSIVPQEVLDRLKADKDSAHPTPQPAGALDSIIPKDLLDRIQGFQDAAANARGAVAAAAISPASLVAGPGSPAPPVDLKLKIDITGAPKGTRVTADPRNTADIDLSVGYQMMGHGT